MKDDIKTFNIRIPKELWISVKTKVMVKGISMNSLILSLLEKYNKKSENNLTKE